MTPPKKLLGAAALLGILLFTFWYGGSAPGLQGWQISSPNSSVSFETPDSSLTVQPQSSTPDTSPKTPDASHQSSITTEPNSSSALSAGSEPSELAPPTPSPEAVDPSLSQSVISEESPKEPVSSSDTTSSGVNLTSPDSTSVLAEPVCTISISCSAVLDHLDWLDPDKVELIPADGIILPETTISFSQGDSAFTLLQQITRQESIHLEASFTPGYGSSYVEGIANLYEFDCGQQSGWLYRVNGISPGYSSSQYTLHDGDVVEWIYTCDLGADVEGTP
ncbi:MAG: DUF4430 domain-containing protein [Lawsonibacter sp.]|jgi:hypothetical protein